MTNKTTVQLRGIGNVSQFYAACEGFENGPDFLEYFKNEIKDKPRFEELCKTADNCFVYSVMAKNHKKQVIRLQLTMTKQAAKAEDGWAVPIDGKNYRLEFYLLPNPKEDPDGPTARFTSQDDIGRPELSFSNGTMHMRAGDFLDAILDAYNNIFPDSGIFRTPTTYKQEN